MTDAFASYGEVAAPVFADPRANRRKKDPSALDLKMEAKARHFRDYKRIRREEKIALLVAEPRLLDFMRYLNAVGPDDGDDLLDGLRAATWLIQSSPTMRLFALRQIADREDKIRLALGLIPFDDPLPEWLGGPGDSAYQKARAILLTGGPL